MLGFIWGFVRSVLHHRKEESDLAEYYRIEYPKQFNPFIQPRLQDRWASCWYENQNINKDSTNLKDSRRSKK